MKIPKFSIFFLLLVIVFISCKEHDTGKIIKASMSLKETCQTEAGHTYAYYVPSHDFACKEMPLLIVLDPHGAGNSAIKKFIFTAEKYKCIVAASNLIKNNYAGLHQSINYLIDDLKHKFSVSNHVIICGFSGGARMAISYAHSEKTLGILACGALASVDELKESNTFIYSIMGMTDFNFPEIAGFIIQPETKPVNLFIEIAGDVHEWPDSSVISRGIGFLLLKTKINREDCLNQKSGNFEIENDLLTAANSNVHSQELLKAKLLYSNFLELEKTKHEKLARKSLDSILNSSEYINEIQLFKKSLYFEMKLREAYYNAFSTSDINWWTREIGSLNRQIEVATDKYELAAYKRIRAFIGIMCYSLARNAVLSNDFTTGDKILTIYKFIEPQNADMYFYSALYYLKKGNNKLAEELLILACKNGFNDQELLKQQFPKNIADRVIQ